MDKLFVCVACFSAVCRGMGSQVSPAVTPEREKDVVWIEAEEFVKKGDWIVDTQFTHKMGSAYLLCPGRNVPTAHPATTTVEIPEAGDWTAWVRTKDWLPEFSPGRFALVVNGAESSVLGASKRLGWRWEKAGVFALKAGKTELALKDLSGAYARCDAILLTTNQGLVPPEETSALERKRARFSGAGLDIREGGTFDVVVVGSGPGGMGASLGAARNGARVALVFDRPVAGGNASSECGIGFDGASLGHRNARESGVVEEIRLTKVYRGSSYTAAFEEMTRKTPSLALFRNERVMRVEKEGPAIVAVLSRNTLTGRWTRWRGKIFVDSTGDGWIAHFAGARTMYGREAGAEYGEEWIAPKVSDKLTMSGKIAWSGGWDTKRPVKYETPVWARVMPKGFDRRVLTPDSPWWLEAPGRFDDVEDPETARDHMIRIDFAYWGWLKNEWAKKDTIANWQMLIPGGFNGRREGMRVVGDYVLTANDCRAGRMFEDRVSYGGWSLDTHDPLGMDNPHGDGWWHPHMGVPIYSVPYRSLYSADVPNLFLGSRCESMTHIALGSMRVQGTQMAVGQAVGTAAALCLKHGLGARELGKSRIAELQQQLLKDDQYIPNLRNADPLDLARKAVVTATSCLDGSVGAGDEEEAERRRATGALHEIGMARGVSFLWGTTERLEGVKCMLKSELDRTVRIKATIVGVGSAQTPPDCGRVIAECEGVVPGKSHGLVAFRPASSIAVTEPYVWILLAPCRGVKWQLRSSLLGAGARAWKNGATWMPVAGQQYSFVTEPSRRDATPSSPEGVVDGVARPVDDCVHGWISDPGQPLPQTLTLAFAKPASVGEVRLAFDSDLTPMRVKGRMPPKLAKSYVVEGCVDGAWVRLVDERENFLRHRVHRFPARMISALRIRVEATWGDPSARIFEMRAYAGDVALAGPRQTGRRLVWSDEFEGKELDPAKWNFRRTMWSKDCEYAHDTRTVCVEDGLLHLKTIRSGLPEKHCLLSEGVTTHDGMSWRYGYLEMRARVPFKHGAWPSFWMQSTPRHRKVDYLSEIDIFEVFSSTNSLAANIHKWGGGKHTMLGASTAFGTRWHTFADGERLNDEFHVYGFEWTPVEMSFYVDGRKYYSRAIDEEHDFDTVKIPGMRGFHDFMFIIFNNEVFTPGHGFCPPGKELKPEDLPIEYWIDWVRLYQGPGEEIRLSDNR